MLRRTQFPVQTMELQQRETDCIVFCNLFVLLSRVGTQEYIVGDNWNPAVTWAIYTGENVRVTVS